MPQFTACMHHLNVAEKRIRSKGAQVKLQGQRVLILRTKIVHEQHHMVRGMQVTFAGAFDVSGKDDDQSYSKHIIA